MNNQITGSREWNILFVNSTYLKEVINVADIISTEAYATLRHILPASFIWIWRKYITHEIKTIPILVTLEKVSKIAYLNIHGDSYFKSEHDSFPILLSHGDYGHPYSMLHLADIAQKKGKPVFSLYIPGVENNAQFNIHNCILQRSIDLIESIVKDNHGRFAGVLGVGHSKGAILFAHRQFVILDQRIKATCSIAGRLKVFENECPDPILKQLIKKIYEAIVNHTTFPIMQIIPKEDWNAPYEAMAVRPHEYCYTVPGKHLSGLFSCETRKYFADFIASGYTDG